MDWIRIEIIISTAIIFFLLLTSASMLQETIDLKKMASPKEVHVRMSVQGNIHLKPLSSSSYFSSSALNSSQFYKIKDQIKVEVHSQLPHLSLVYSSFDQHHHHVLLIHLSNMDKNGGSTGVKSFLWLLGMVLALLVVVVVVVVRGKRRRKKKRAENMQERNREENQLPSTGRASGSRMATIVSLVTLSSVVVVVAYSSSEMTLYIPTSIEVVRVFFQEEKEEAALERHDGFNQVFNKLPSTLLKIYDLPIVPSLSIPPCLQTNSHFSLQPSKSFFESIQPSIHIPSHFNHTFSSHYFPFKKRSNPSIYSSSKQLLHLSYKQLPPPNLHHSPSHPKPSFKLLKSSQQHLQQQYNALQKLHKQQLPLPIHYPPIHHTSPHSVISLIYPSIHAPNFSFFENFRHSDKKQDGECLATCDVITRHVCFCERGFQLVEGVCVDVDECLLDVCPGMCTNTIGSYICACEYGFYQHNHQCVECSKSCPPNHFQATSCSNAQDVVCTECTECAGSTYEIRQCTNFTDRQCIHVSYPSLFPDNDLLDQEPLQETRLTSSSNVLWEDLMLSKVQETKYNINQLTSHQTFQWDRSSGVKVTVEVEDLKVIGRYRDDDARGVSGVQGKGDLDYVEKNKIFDSEEKKNFLFFKENVCKHPVPDYYSLSLEITKNRITNSSVIICDSNNPALPPCPPPFQDGDRFLFRSLNEPCHKEGTYPEILYSGNNNIVSTEFHPLLSHLFHLSYSPIKPLIYKTQLCDDNSYRCKQCLESAAYCPTKLNNNKFSCCTNYCYTLDPCKVSVTGSCAGFPVECSEGAAYRYTLQPVFENLEGEFQCYIKRSSPQYLYKLKYYFQIPSVNYTSAVFSRKISTKDLEKVSAGTFKSHFLVFHHNSSLALAEDFILAGKRIDTKSDYNSHNLHKKFSYKLFTLPPTKQTSQGGTEALNNKQQDKSNKERNKPLNTNLHKGQNPIKDEIKVQKIMENVYVAHFQFLRPFDFTSSNWNLAKVARPGMLERFRNNKGRYNHVKEQGARVTWKQSHNSFIYHVTSNQSEPFIKITIPSNESVLSHFFTPSSSSSSLPHLLFDSQSPFVSLNLVNSKKLWEIQVQGKMSLAYGYLGLKVYNHPTNQLLSNFELFITDPPTFNLSIKIPNWSHHLDKTFYLVFSDWTGSRTVYLTYFYFQEEVSETRRSDENLVSFEQLIQPNSPQRTSASQSDFSIIFLQRVFFTLFSLIFILIFSLFLVHFLQNVRKVRTESVQMNNSQNHAFCTQINDKQNNTTILPRNSRSQNSLVNNNLNVNEVVVGSGENIFKTHKHQQINTKSNKSESRSNINSNNKTLECENCSGIGDNYSNCKFYKELKKFRQRRKTLLVCYWFLCISATLSTSFTASFLALKAINTREIDRLANGLAQNNETSQNIISFEKEADEAVVKAYKMVLACSNYADTILHEVLQKSSDIMSRQPFEHPTCFFNESPNRKPNKYNFSYFKNSQKSFFKVDKINANIETLVKSVVASLLPGLKRSLSTYTRFLESSMANLWFAVPLDIFNKTRLDTVERKELQMKLTYLNHLSNYKDFFMVSRPYDPYEVFADEEGGDDEGGDGVDESGGGSGGKRGWRGTFIGCSKMSLKGKTKKMFGDVEKILNGIEVRFGQFLGLEEVDLISHWIGNFIKKVNHLTPDNFNHEIPIPRCQPSALHSSSSPAELPAESHVIRYFVSPAFIDVFSQANKLHNEDYSFDKPSKNNLFFLKNNFDKNFYKSLELQKRPYGRLSRKSLFQPRFFQHHPMYHIHRRSRSIREIGTKDDKRCNGCSERNANVTNRNEHKKHRKIFEKEDYYPNFPVKYGKFKKLKKRTAINDLQKESISSEYKLLEDRTSKKPKNFKNKEIIKNNNNNENNNNNKNNHKIIKEQVTNISALNDEANSTIIGTSTEQKAQKRKQENHHKTPGNQNPPSEKEEEEDGGSDEDLKTFEFPSIENLVALKVKVEPEEGEKNDEINQNLESLNKKLRRMFLWFQAVLLCLDVAILLRRVLKLHILSRRVNADEKILIRKLFLAKFGSKKCEYKDDNSASLYTTPQNVAHSTPNNDCLNCSLENRKQQQKRTDKLASSVVCCSFFETFFSFKNSRQSSKNTVCGTFCRLLKLKTTTKILKSLTAGVVIFSLSCIFISHLSRCHNILLNLQQDSDVSEALSSISQLLNQHHNKILHKARDTSNDSDNFNHFHRSSANSKEAFIKTRGEDNDNGDSLFKSEAFLNEDLEQISGLVDFFNQAQTRLHRSREEDKCLLYEMLNNSSCPKMTSHPEKHFGRSYVGYNDGNNKIFKSGDDFEASNPTFGDNDGWLGNEKEEKEYDDVEKINLEVLPCNYLPVKPVKFTHGGSDKEKNNEQIRQILKTAEKLLIKSSLFLVAALLVYVLLQLLCWGIQCCLASGCCIRCTKQFSSVEINEDDVVEEQQTHPPQQQTPQPPLQHSTLPIRIHKTQETHTQPLYSSSLDNYNIQQFTPTNIRQQNLHKQALQHSLQLQTIRTQPKFSETKV